MLADKYDGKKFNSPNDLWIDPKGGVYFTDPRYGNREGMEQDGEHVYYLTPDRKTVIRVINDMVRPNGLIGTPNGKTLYVADDGAGKTYVYKINKDGTLTDKQLFAPEGSDGMTIDNKGNVYLTTKVVAVYNTKGEKIEEIPGPRAAGQPHLRRRGQQHPVHHGPDLALRRGHAGQRRRDAHPPRRPKGRQIQSDQGPEEGQGEQAEIASNATRLDLHLLR